MKLLAVIISTYLLHPFFMSVIDIKHNAKEKNVEISIRVFTDDLESTLRKNLKKNIDLVSGVNKPEINNVVSNYIQNKLHLIVNDKQQAIKYIGYEIQKESTWIYAEITDVATVKKININCSFLYEFNDKQSNIFNILVNNIEKNYKLDYPNSNISFTF